MGFSLIDWMPRLSRPSKLAILVAADIIIFAVSLFLAYGLRFSTFAMFRIENWHLYVPAILLSVTGGLVTGLYWSSTRVYSYDTEKRIVVAQVMAALAWVVLLFLVGTAGFPRSIVGIYFLLSTLGMIALRKVAAALLDHENIFRRKQEMKSCLVFGAGYHGNMVVQTMRKQNRYKPLAFIDSDYSLINGKVSGLNVYPLEKLDFLIDRYKPEMVIIAKPGLPRSGIRSLFDTMTARGLSTLIAPEESRYVEGSSKLAEIRHIGVDDLLGREPVAPEQHLLNLAAQGKCIMVTGAGGSIGSELARQVLKCAPRKLLLVELNEFALFEIHRAIAQEIARSAPMEADDAMRCEVHAILADVKDGEHISRLMQQHDVQVVFHAAAYKHVHMVQENSIAGFRNNVLGTLAVAQAARKNAVERFILVSTDKAVRPTSMMGASKRVSEMVVQALAAEDSGGTIFSMVRFGNVLGSTGSVVPIFREQIAAGGPVTVTHPEVTRYFMLIPEAAQLVIQAGAMAKGGEVYVLDMGEPVRIVKLAETMIELAGLTVKNEQQPDGDIEISFTGLKPGEKLYEELLIGDNMQPTSNPRIGKCMEFRLTLAQLTRRITDMTRAADAHDVDTVQESLMTLASLNSDMPLEPVPREPKSAATPSKVGLSKPRSRRNAA